MICRERLMELFVLDTDEWKLRYRIPRRGCRPGDACETVRPDGYVSLVIERRRYLLHRMIWLYVHGDCPAIIDHIDGNPSNNALSNLRAATHSQNMANRPPQKNNSSGVKGVSFDRARNRWTASLTQNRKLINLGRFQTKAEAVAARRSAEEKYHGEFAWKAA